MPAILPLKQCFTDDVPKIAVDVETDSSTFISSKPSSPGSDSGTRATPRHAEIAQGLHIRMRYIEDELAKVCKRVDAHDQNWDRQISKVRSPDVESTFRIKWDGRLAQGDDAPQVEVDTSEAAAMFARLQHGLSETESMLKTLESDVRRLRCDHASLDEKHNHLDSHVEELVAFKHKFAEELGDVAKECRNHQKDTVAAIEMQNNNLVSFGCQLSDSHRHVRSHGQHLNTINERCRQLRRVMDPLREAKVESQVSKFRAV